MSFISTLENELLYSFSILYILKVRFSKQKKLSESVFYDIDSPREMGQKFQ